MLADPQVEAVLILTTPNAREALVAAAARAGKHVLMEKPVERTLAAAQRIVATCDAGNIKLGIIFQHRFRRASRILGEIVAESRYGRLEAVHLVVPWWRPQADMRRWSARRPPCGPRSTCSPRRTAGLPR